MERRNFNFVGHIADADVNPPDSNLHNQYDNLPDRQHANTIQPRNDSQDSF